MSKLLIIDDQPENVNLLSIILKREGFDTISAYDGKAGLELAFTHSPDLVLLDVMMPGITGLEVCQILTSDPRTMYTPVIMVTAKSSAEDTSAGLEAGAFDYIKKPYNRLEIVARIRSALKLRNAQKALVESEKMNIYAATVVTANHKIKQPLTVMKLSVSALRREIEKDEMSKENLKRRLEYLETATDEITDVLNQLKLLKHLQISDYLKNIKMIDIDNQPPKEQKEVKGPESEHIPIPQPEQSVLPLTDVPQDSKDQKTAE
ncbi:Transcriptional regulatory protein WalR [uncultured bacterium]|nr:Transcriptional regulatory protein WalR [uncultured bacterium]